MTAHWQRGPGEIDYQTPESTRELERKLITLLKLKSGTALNQYLHKTGELDTSKSVESTSVTLDSKLSSGGLRSVNLTGIIGYNPPDEEETREFPIFIKRALSYLRNSSGSSAGQCRKARLEALLLAQLSTCPESPLPPVLLVDPDTMDCQHNIPQTIVMKRLQGRDLGARYRCLSDNQVNVLNFVYKHDGQITTQDVMKNLVEFNSSTLLCDLFLLEKMGLVTIISDGKKDYISLNQEEVSKRFNLLPYKARVSDGMRLEEDSMRLEENPKFRKRMIDAFRKGIEALVTFEKQASDFKFEPDCNPKSETAYEKRTVIQEKIDHILAYRREHQGDQRIPRTVSRKFLDMYQTVMFSDNRDQVVQQGDPNIFNFFESDDGKVYLLDLFHCKRDEEGSDLIDFIQSVSVLSDLKEDERTGLLSYGLELKGIPKREKFKQWAKRRELDTGLYVLGAIAGTYINHLMTRDEDESKKLKIWGIAKQGDMIRQFEMYRGYMILNRLFSIRSHSHDKEATEIAEYIEFFLTGESSEGLVTNPFYENPYNQDS